LLSNFNLMKDELKKDLREHFKKIELEIERIKKFLKSNQVDGNIISKIIEDFWFTFNGF